MNHRLCLPLIILFSLSWVPAQAETPAQQDAAKLLPWVRQQREAAQDNAAQCYMAATELQNRVTELEKQVSDLKAAHPDTAEKPAAKPGG